MVKAKKKKTKVISSQEFDKKFDDGEDISEYIDKESVTRKILVDFPEWMIKEMDIEATRVGVARTALIKMWVDERLAGLKKQVG